MKRAAYSCMVLCVLSLCGSCVTEAHSPAVTIHAGASGSIYPPAVLYGAWRSEDRVLVFQRPPGAAVVSGRGRRMNPYDIAALRRNSDGAYTMQLAPRGGGPTIERTFFLPEENRLREVEGGDAVNWTRARE